MCTETTFHDIGDYCLKKMGSVIVVAIGCPSFVAGAQAGMASAAAMAALLLWLEPGLPEWVAAQRVQRVVWLTGLIFKCEMF